MIGGLSNDLLHTVIRHLPLQDWRRLSLVSRRFAEVMRQAPLWQYLIAQYFPYLIDSGNHQAQYERAPSRLFIAHYHTVQHALENFFRSHLIKFQLFREHIFANLRNVISDRFGSLPEQFILAASNGFESALDKLKDFDRGIALLLAAWLGNLRAVQMILNRSAETISMVHKGTALRYASFYQHLEIVKYLLRKVKGTISSEDKGLALTEASSVGDVGIVEFLLNEAGDSISTEHKGHGLRYAATSGYAALVEMLLSKESQVIPPKHKVKALKFAASFNHAEVIEVLLNRVSDEIPIQEKEQVFFNISQSGDTASAVLFLSKVGDQISVESKELARLNATRLGHQGVVDELLRLANEEEHLSEIDKGIAKLKV